MSDNEAGAPLRILHAPRNIASQASDVAAGLRRLGHHVEVWDDRVTAFELPADRVLDYASRDPRAVWDAIAQAIDGFDVLHFHFGRSLVPGAWSGLPPLWDLPLYRALGKRIYFTFHGSDARIGRIHREINPWAATAEGLPEPDDDWIEKSVQVIRTYADRMFSVSVNGLVYVPDAEYLPRVIDLARWPVIAHEQRDVPVILHAPTRRATKGTDTVLRGLDALAADGVRFELRLLEDVPHDEVRAQMADADILVDNVIAGAYGIVSLEAMASATVPVANVSDPVWAAHPDAPILHVDPLTFTDRMRHLIGDVAGRRRLAALGRPFVELVHDVDPIAARLEAAYTAPRSPVRLVAMPDWTSYRRPRRIEQLEERLAIVEAELGRSRRRELDLRRRLGLPDEPSPRSRAVRAVARRFTPEPVRTRIRSIRRRVSR